MTEKDVAREQEQPTIDSSELLRRAMGLSALDMANTDTLPRLTRQQVTGEEASRLERIHALLEADQSDLAPHVISFDEWSDPDSNLSHPSRLLGTALHFMTPDQHHLLHVLSQTQPAILVPFLEFLHATFRGGNEGPRFYQIAHRRLYRLRMAMHGLSSTATAALDSEKPETVRAFYGSISRTFLNQKLSESVTRAFEAMVISIDDPEAAKTLATDPVQRPRGNSHVFPDNNARISSYISEYNAAERGTERALWVGETQLEQSEWAPVLERLAPDFEQVAEVLPHFDPTAESPVAPDILARFLELTGATVEPFASNGEGNFEMTDRLYLRFLFNLAKDGQPAKLLSAREIAETYKSHGAQQKLVVLPAKIARELSE